MGTMHAYALAVQLCPSSPLCICAMHPRDCPESSNTDDQPAHRDGDPLFTPKELDRWGAGSEDIGAGNAPFSLPPHALHVWLPIWFILSLLHMPTCLRMAGTLACLCVTLVCLPASSTRSHTHVRM